MLGPIRGCAAECSLITVTRLRRWMYTWSFFLLYVFFCWAYSRLRRGLFLDYCDAAAPLIVYMILFFIIYFLLGPFAAAPRYYLSTAVNIFKSSHIFSRIVVTDLLWDWLTQLNTLLDRMLFRCLKAFSARLASRFIWKCLQSTRGPRNAILKGHFAAAPR